MIETMTSVLIGDAIYNYIYYKDNSDNSIDLYIYGDDNAKSFLNFNTTNHTILTNKGKKGVNENYTLIHTCYLKINYNKPLIIHIKENYND